MIMYIIKVVLFLRFLYTLTLYSSNPYAIVSTPIWLIKQIGDVHILHSLNFFFLIT